MKKIKIDLNVNGEPVSVECEEAKTLLEVIREEIGLKGTKRGCQIGECGACTVILNGKVVNSCMVLASQVRGASIVTVEGLSSGGRLHPLQKAFIEKGAVQCGFCTPGMLLSAKALLERNPSPDREEIKKAIAGNLCRCTGYKHIIEAIEQVAKGSNYDDKNS